MRLVEASEPFADGLAKLLGLERHRPPVLSQHPAGEEVDRRELGLEHAVLDRAGVGQRALDPPGGVVGDGDPGGPGRLPDLPRLRDAVLLHVEVLGHAEVPLAAGGEADVAADARDLERPDGVPLEVLPDHVPVPVVEPKCEGVDRSFARARATRAPVAEAHGALLRDRGLELREAAGELGRVVGSADPHALCRLGRRLREAGAAEREVLEREAERLGVGELAFQVVQRRLQRGELVVVELEPVEEVVLRAKRVQLLPGELVALRGERDAQRGQLRAVRIEPAGRRPRRTSRCSPRRST